MIKSEFRGEPYMSISICTFDEIINLLSNKNMINSNLQIRTQSFIQMMQRYYLKLTTAVFQMNWQNLP